MKNQKFKVGDKVYCIPYAKNICQIQDHGVQIKIINLTSKEYHATPDDCGLDFADDGETLVLSDSNFYCCQLVHATPENHALLEKLYGVEFEAPPKQKEPIEIIRAMLDDGWDSVPCKVSDHDFLEHSGDFIMTYITDIDEDKNEYWDYQGTIWQYAKLFDPKTDKKIIDYVDGQPILE